MAINLRGFEAIKYIKKQRKLNDFFDILQTSCDFRVIKTLRSKKVID